MKKGISFILVLAMLLGLGIIPVNANPTVTAVRTVPDTLLDQKFKITLSVTADSSGLSNAEVVDTVDSTYFTLCDNSGNQVGDGTHFVETGQNITPGATKDYYYYVKIRDGFFGGQGVPTNVFEESYVSAGGTVLTHPANTSVNYQVDFSVDYVNNYVHNLYAFCGDYADLSKLVTIADFNGIDNSFVNVIYEIRDKNTNTSLGKYTINAGETDGAWTWTTPTENKNIQYTDDHLLEMILLMEASTNSGNKHSSPKDLTAYIYKPEFSAVTIDAIDKDVPTNTDYNVVDKCLNISDYSYVWKASDNTTAPAASGPAVSFEIKTALYAPAALYQGSWKAGKDGTVFHTPADKSDITPGALKSSDFNVSKVTAKFNGSAFTKSVILTRDAIYFVNKAQGNADTHDFTLNVKPDPYYIIDLDGGTWSTTLTSGRNVYYGAGWTEKDYYSGSATYTRTALFKFKNSKNLTVSDLGKPSKAGGDKVFDKWQVTENSSYIQMNALTPSAANNHIRTFKALWEDDIIGSQPSITTYPGFSDGIPDRYQAVAVFHIINGTWRDTGTNEDIYQCVTMTSKGSWSLDNADHVKFKKYQGNANSGYTNGTWDKDPTSYVINELSALLTKTTIAEFTLSYEAGQSGGGGGGGGGGTSYTLSYQSNGGTSYKDESYSSGTKVEIDKVPEKKGYTFEGWYIDSGLTKRVTSVEMTSDITVYAKWSQVPEMLNGKDHYAYIIGYGNGDIRPNNKISRAEVATIFFRLLTESVRDNNFTKTNSFKDVSNSVWYNNPVSTMSKLGIVVGDERGFRPDDPITRAEFATICARFDKSEVTNNSFFNDIEKHWASSYINRAASLGWVTGYENGSFRPDNYITRAEAVTIINRVLNRIPEKSTDLLPEMVTWKDNKADEWFYLAVQEASNSHDWASRDGKHEYWTKLTAPRDWSTYEK